MIKNFSYINGEGATVSVRLTDNPSEALYSEEDKELFFEIYFSKKIGISWMNNDEQIQLIKKNEKITGYPSVDLNYIIVTRDRSIIIVYNADGTIHNTVSLPALKSELSKRHFRNMKYPNTMYFGKISWEKDQNDRTTVAVVIGFAQGWYEIQSFDPESGEFGECISSGRI